MVNDFRKLSPFSSRNLLSKTPSKSLDTSNHLSDENNSDDVK